VFPLAAVASIAQPASQPDCSVISRRSEHRPRRGLRLEVPAPVVLQGQHRQRPSTLWASASATESRTRLDRVPPYPGQGHHGHRPRSRSSDASCTSLASPPTPTTTVSWSPRRTHRSANPPFACAINTWLSGYAGRLLADHGRKDRTSHLRGRPTVLSGPEAIHQYISRPRDLPAPLRSSA